MTLEALLSKLCAVRPEGNGWKALCPAHADKNPSLSIRQADGKTLIHCHAGCSTEAVLTALGMEVRDLFEDERGERQIVAEYDYRDEKGELLFQVVRYQPKDFCQRRPDGRGGWIWKLNGTRRVLYRLADVIAAPAVIICEGEKDCEAARALGLVATCNPHGAGKWKLEYAEPLKGKRVCVIADADELGRKHARDIATSLVNKVDSLRVLELPGAKDLTEWIERGGTRAALLEYIRNAPKWKDESKEDSARIELVPADAFLKRISRDEREWLAEGLLPASSQTIWQGRPKVGKSHSLLQLGYDLSSGLAVFGRFAVTRPVRCAYVELEEPEAITKTRYMQMLQANSGQGPEPRNFRFFTREDSHRLRLLPRELLGSCLKAFIGALRDVGTELVILIALRKFLYGGENLKDPETAERVNDALDMILQETHAAIILANHDRKQEAGTIEAQGFGSTFVSARADGCFDLARASGGIRRVRCEARFDAPEEFFLERVTVGEGDTIRCCEAPLDSNQNKREEALRLVKEGKSMREAADSVGVSHTTVRNWIKDREEGT
jgi:hypothetical protein